MHLRIDHEIGYVRRGLIRGQAHPVCTRLDLSEGAILVFDDNLKSDLGICLSSG